ncbi:PIN domain-containing protein [Streptomyces sp. NPDC053086]|uniref:PIN domain-containing protein n=1 Tax=unclassified Streptomyces TaxID=2593676 RepID=UPI0037D49E7C
MIILDANIIKGTSLRSSVADMLRAIRAAGVERVGTPWIAVEEVAAQQVLAYQAKHDAARAAVDELHKATPWDHVAHPKRWQDEHVREHWRERYASITEVLETSPAVYQQALYRETNLIEPCKTVNSGKHKTGARDAAIWLTAVEYARDHPEETVYFVSNDTDHSSDGKLPEPMQRDIAGMEDESSWTPRRPARWFWRRLEHPPSAIG